MLLVTTAHPQMVQHAHPNLGRLIQPRHYSSIEKTAASGVPWAADNDCFQGLDADAFTNMLDRIKGLPGCLWVACPDVVGDHQATIRQFYRWAPGIARRGLPIAFVLQDGCTIEGVPWRDIAAVFVGGTDTFKMSVQATELVAEAKRRGLWAHMGRVNTWRRTKYAASIGCDSIDGTRNSRFRDTYLNKSLGEVSALVQGML
jgi:hypothetical protein